MWKKKEEVVLNGYVLAWLSLLLGNKYIRNSQKYVWVESFWVFKFLILFLFVADPTWGVPCPHDKGRTWP
jgi:hypothetical protein